MVCLCLLLLLFFLLFYFCSAVRYIVYYSWSSLKVLNKRSLVITSDTDSRDRSESNLFFFFHTHHTVQIQTNGSIVYIMNRNQHLFMNYNIRITMLFLYPLSCCWWRWLLDCLLEIETKCKIKIYLENIYNFRWIFFFFSSVEINCVDIRYYHRNRYYCVDPTRP